MSELSTEQQEYDSAYDAEMERLNSTEPGTNTPEPTIEQPQNEPEQVAKVETAQEVDYKAEWEKAQATLASKEKALSDTQRWAHKEAAEKKEANRKIAEYERSQRARPALLDDIPELADVVNYAIEDLHNQHQTLQEKQEQHLEQRQHQALDIVIEAIPDVPALLDDESFKNAMIARRDAIGAEKFDFNPSIMIREINAEKHARFQAQQEVAISAAKAEFAKTQKAKSSMSMPTGAIASNKASLKDMSYADVMNMSDAEYKAWQNRTLGY